jgi:hypothetical protein
MADESVTRTEKGAGLARGPALILGVVLEVAGLYFLYKQHQFPPLSNFPNGKAPVTGKVFLGLFGANGWTGLFTAAAGGLLLFGAAQHLLAKAISLIVGVALGAAAVIALISGNVLGLAAANGWTELGWGVCAVILLLNSAAPRRRRTVTEPAAAERGRTTRAAPAAVRTPAGERTTSGDRTVVGDRPADGDRTVVGNGAAAGERTTADEPLTRPRDGGEDPAADPAADETRRQR